MAARGNEVLTARYDEALVYAAELHRSQTRKGNGTPYLAHLLSVSALVIENGGDEDQAIAGLLHDAVEDQGGVRIAEEIQRRFGEGVVGIVLACTESLETPKPPWEERKVEHLERLRNVPPAVRIVSLADKIHNARSLLQELDSQGEATWSLFRGGKDGTLWYYRSMLEVHRHEGPPAMVAELDSLVRELERRAVAELA